MNAELQSPPSLRPARPGVLVAGLCLYAVLSLISMAAMSIGAGLLGLCIVAAYGGPSRFWKAFASLFRGSPGRIRAFAWISFGFAVICVLSLVAGRYWPLEFGGHAAHVEILKDSAKIWYFAWPFVLWFALSACTSGERRKVLVFWFLTLGLLSVIGIQQHWTGWPRPQKIPPWDVTYHATLFLGHHLSVASILIFPFFALLDLSASGFFGDSSSGRALRWLIVALAAITLVFTFSRTLWIALPAGLIFWIFLRFGNRTRAAIIVFSIVGAAVAFQVPTIHRELTAHRGIQEREDLWEANWVFFRDRPVLGVGLKRNQELSGYYLMQKYHTNHVFEGHAHDDVLDILGSMGLLGLAAFIAWWVALVALVVRAIRVGPVAGPFFGKGLLAAFLVFQINGLTQVNFWEAKVQHQLMWMAAWALLWCGETLRA